MDETRFGYPSKKRIKKLLNLYDIDTSKIVFSDGYESGRRGGIFWRETNLKKAMYGVENHLAKYGIKILRVKHWGEVHSIRLKKIKLKY